MKFSTKSRYALRVMVDLAENPEKQNIKAIASRQDISEKYLEQIVSCLSKAGLVSSTRGAAGGYTLSRPATQIFVGEILRAAEGNLFVIECLDPKLPCNREDKCRTHTCWNKLNTLVNNFLDSVSLKDVIEDKL